jgi:uncharacterized protein
MPRPRQCRRVEGLPSAAYFKPRGVPLVMLEEVALAVDEFEALRLADLEGLYQEQAAEKMGVSRQTFGRAVESARRKVADALVNGKALKIEGGDYMVMGMRTFTCSGCQHAWQAPHGADRPAECPKCRGTNFHRAAEERGPRGSGGRGWRGGRSGRA